MREVSRRGLVTAAGAVLLTAACGTEDPEKTSGEVKATDPEKAPAKPVSDDIAVDPPKQLKGALFSTDVLVYSQKTLDKATIENTRRIKGVVAVETISMGQFFVDDQEVTYAAVNPETFWRYTQPGTAQTQAVWDRVAAGEMAVEPVMGHKIQAKDGYIAVGNETAAKRIHVGAYAQILAPTVAKRIDAVVNYKWADRLGMQKDNAIIVAMDATSPQSIRKQLQKYAGTKASVQILGPDLDLKATQTAFLTGGSVSAAVGSFSYKANSDGTVDPDPSWVSRNIRTMEMPIIGKVTGHRVMLPQLQAALQEVVARGLSSKIHTYDGCYVPRFIAHDPSKGLSFHTFGTAIDLNAYENGRGTAGKMDRTVVAIFKRWGFAWGGDWNYTDPMHFELAKLVKPR
jgi:D-alanyl-D-alanine carboxypeptidase